MDVPLGTAIGKYQVTELVGRGAMASIYRVRHVQLRTEYALKVLEVTRPDVCERLVHEGRIQASLRHPNVVGVTDVIRVGGQPALVLEYVDGPDLELFLHKRAPLSLAEIDGIATGILRGVRAAHRAGHLHRDLKPSNILLARQDDVWVPKVADFGLAKVLGDGDPESTASTRSGQIMGSPPFMSPEQCRDSSTVDERSDVFALGAVLYELATGQRAFQGPDIVAIFTRIASGAYVPLPQLRPDLPAHMVEAIHGALVVDREHRIPDVDTLLDVWSGQARFAVRANDVSGSMIALLGQAAPPAAARSSDTLLGRSSASLAAVPVTVWGSMASLMAIGTLIVGLVAGGVVVAALFVATGWTGSDPPPAPAPVPLAAAPQPVPDPAPALAPDPLPAPAALPDPAPQAPAPVVARPVPSAPPAAPAPVGTGRFRVQGEASVVLWNAGGTYNHWEQVPVGTYRVNALFHGDTHKVPLRDLAVEVRRDATAVLVCDAVERACAVGTDEL